MICALRTLLLGFGLLAGSATAQPDGGLTRLDLRAGLGLGAAGPADFVEAEAAAMAQSRYLGPFMAEVVGTYGFASQPVRVGDADVVGREVFAIGAGLGIARTRGTVQPWAVATVWSQTSLRRLGPAYGLAVGAAVPVSSRLAAYAQVRAMASDVRAADADGSFATTGTIGLRIEP